MPESMYRRCDDIIETELGNTTGKRNLHAEMLRRYDAMVVVKISKKNRSVEKITWPARRSTLMKVLFELER